MTKKKRIKICFKTIIKKGFLFFLFFKHSNKKYTPDSLKSQHQFPTGFNESVCVCLGGGGGDVFL